MLQVIESPDNSIVDPIVELNSIIAEAYGRVQIARRAIATLTSAPPELSTHLQLAEAELVRASVAARKIEPIAEKPIAQTNLIKIGTRDDQRAIERLYRLGPGSSPALPPTDTRTSH